MQTQTTKVKTKKKRNALKVIGLILAALIVILAILIVIPPKVSVAGIPAGFTEKQFNTGEVTLNYVEGPDHGTPFLLIPGQMESWQGYKAVMPDLAKKFHVFVVDVRGQGKSSRTPGHYSYNSCGQDFKIFLERVIQKPALVSGLSSGAVLTVWLAAYSPESVEAIIVEDPPMFSSIWPRIKQERYMTYIFQNAVDTLGSPKGRNLEAYLAGSGMPNPKEGEDGLLYIPAPIARGIATLFNINKKLRPNRPYDVPFLSFEIRAGAKFISEYDVDFSRATIDGRLSEGFDPEDALKKVKCPMLLLQAAWSRHKTWGLLGAMDDQDVQKIRSLVNNFQYAHINSSHAIHMAEPKWYLQQINRFVDGL